MRSSLCLGLLITPLAHSLTCAVYYDKAGYGNTKNVPMLSTLSQITDDMECTEIIIYPPVPALGSTNSVTGIQKLTMTPDSRKQLKTFLLTENFLDSIKDHRITLAGFKEFQKQIKTNEKVEKQFIYFHGSDGFVYADTLKLSQKPETQNVMKKEFFDSDDLKNVFEDKPEYVLPHFTSVTSNAKTVYKNPCYDPEANALSTATPVPDKVGDAIRLKLVDLVAKNSAGIDCTVLPKIKDLIEKYGHATRDEAFCKDITKRIAAYIKYSKCVQNSFSVNLLESDLLSTPGPGSKTLFFSCAVGAEEDVELTYYTAKAKLCGLQVKQLRDSSLRSYTGQSQRTANKLCKGAAEMSSFAIAANVNYGSPIPPKLDKTKAEDTTNSNWSDIQKLKEPSEQMEMANLYMYSLSNACHDPLATSVDNYTEALSPALASIYSDEGPTGFKMDFAAKKLEELNCSETKLNKCEIVQLREDLVNTHFSLIARMYLFHKGLINTSSEMNDTTENYRFMSESGPELLALKTKLENQYKNIDFSTHAAQVKAYQRYVYFLRETDKLVGYYDCYSCINGNAVSMSCDSLKESFHVVATLDNRKNYNKLKNLAELNRVLDESATAAQNIIPPLCRGPMPQCDFNDPECKTPKKKH